MKLSGSEKAYRGVCMGFCICFALLCLYPLLYTVFLSVCSQKEYVDRGGLLLFMPSHPTITAYVQIFSSTGFILQALGISVARTITGTVLGVLVCSVTAFVLTRKDLPGKNQYLMLLLFTILFSGGLIPTYLTIESLGLRNTFWVMVIPSLMNAWNVLIFKQFFEGIPKELEEAAEVDSVNDLQMFYKIILPMSKPVLASISLFTMVAHWNSWFDASIYIDRTYKFLWPLQHFTRVSFQSPSDLQAGGLDFLINGGGAVSSVSMQMALTIVTMLPILVVYPFFQKYFTKGVYMGAVKG